MMIFVASLRNALVLVAAATMAVAGPSAAVAQTAANSDFAKPAACPLPGAIYRPCEDQRVILAKALAEAKASNAKLIVVFGADWCPWCRSLEKILPTAGVLGDAEFKGRYTFVNIATSVLANGQKISVPTGAEALKNVEVNAKLASNGVPFIAVIDPNRPDRIFATGTDDLEDNSGGQRGHSAEKIKQRLRLSEASLR
jgi:thiol-disulfide isomerase/thioredoxin